MMFLQTDEIDFEALKSVSSLGIDTSFLDQIEGMLKRPPPPPHTEPPVTQHAVGNPDKLKATGQLLKELAATQAARVSRPPPFALTEVSNPSTQEVQLASQVVTNLQTLVPLAGPSAVSNVGTVRSLMGIERPKEILNDEPKKQEKSEGLDMDMDLLREFLHME